MTHVRHSLAGLVAGAVLLLFGCAPLDPSNDDATFERDSVLIGPGGVLEVRVAGVLERDALRLRAPGNTITYSLERDDTGVFARLHGQHEGTVELELLDGGELRDVLTVEVSEYTRAALIPAQNAFVEFFPPVEGPFAVVINHRVAVTLEPMTADGRVLDAVESFRGTLSSDDQSVEVDQEGSFVRVRTSVAGLRPLTFRSSSRELPAVLHAVAPEEVVSLAVDSFAFDGGFTSFSVVGATSDGTPVIGLSPEFIVDGEPAQSTAGDWLFDVETPAVGSVQITWGDLSTTW